MAFFSMFKNSALELKSVRSLTVTALLIGISTALEFLVIQPTPTLKFGFAFIGLAAIGMLYGPVMAGIGGIAVDVLGYIIKPTGAFSPILTVATLVEGIIYGIFLYKMTPAKLDFSGGKAFLSCLKQNAFPALRTFFSRFTVNLVCNVFLNTVGLIIMGFFAPETFWVKMGERIVKNAILLPFEVLVLIPVLYGIYIAYRSISGKNKTAV